MKKKSIISLLIACMGFGMIATSCQDMLSSDSERHSYEVGQDTLYSYWGILKSLQNVAERYVVLGECRGDLVSPTTYVSDSITAILNYDMENATDGSCRYLKASDYYHVINSCNAYLASIDRDRVTGTKEPYMLKESAQVEAIRAWTYLQLVQVYGEVPFYTEPLLTTDEINNFIKDPNSPKINAQNIASLLAPTLLEAQAIELQYGFPQYENYGYTKTVCHSYKAMIPLNLIIADVYLTSGEYANAAQYYYNYLSNNDTHGHLTAGGVIPTGYSSTGYTINGEPNAQYNESKAPWTETGAPAIGQEAITAIPSSTNKLWGNVLRGVNELFGYDAEISVRTNSNDTVTTASVSLTPQYDVKQLRASDNYYDLCKNQDYEIYISASKVYVETGAAPSLEVDPAIGDARQAWVKDVYQTYTNGVSKTEKFVTKQNPGGAFTTVYPMIYRKSMVWLRFAEALNRAGYHSYAFAILKNGMCKNDKWYPNDERYYEKIDSSYYATYVDATGDNETHVWPEEADKNGSEYKTSKEVETAFKAWAKDNGKSITGSKADYKTIKYDNLCEIVLGNQNYANSKANDIVLKYLDRREAINPPAYLNFGHDVFKGNISTQMINFRPALVDDKRPSSTVYTISGEDKVTTGIHYRGCGTLYYNEDRSVFNYVTQITKKAKEYGYDLTKEDIYSGEYDDVVTLCVEDLIVDEEAMELAFEGTRFFDLMRVSDHRGDPSYLAKRLGKRNSELESKLRTRSNWFFPLPKF